MGKILNGHDVINGLKAGVGLWDDMRTEILNIYDKCGLDFIKHHFTNYGNSYDSLDRCLWYDNNNTTSVLYLDGWVENYINGWMDFKYAYLYSHEPINGNPFYISGSTTGKLADIDEVNGNRGLHLDTMLAVDYISVGDNVYLNDQMYNSMFNNNMEMNCSILLTGANYDQVLLESYYSISRSEGFGNFPELVTSPTPLFVPNVDVDNIMNIYVDVKFIFSGHCYDIEGETYKLQNSQLELNSTGAIWDSNGEFTITNGDFRFEFIGNMSLEELYNITSLTLYGTWESSVKWVDLDVTKFSYELDYSATNNYERIPYRWNQQDGAQLYYHTGNIHEYNEYGDSVVKLYCCTYDMTYFFNGLSLPPDSIKVYSENSNIISIDADAIDSYYSDYSEYDLAIGIPIKIYSEFVNTNVNYNGEIIFKLRYIGNGNWDLDNSSSLQNSKINLNWRGRFYVSNLSNLYGVVNGEGETLGPYEGKILLSSSMGVTRNISFEFEYPYDDSDHYITVGNNGRNILQQQTYSIGVTVDDQGGWISNALLVSVSSISNQSARLKMLLEWVNNNEDTPHIFVRE